MQAEAQTLAKQIQKRPIVALLNVKASPFAGVSLSTSSLTALVFDPPYPESIHLQQWKLNNKNSLDQLLLEKSYWNETAKALKNITQTDISAILQSPKGEYQCIAKYQICTAQQANVTYSACNKCKLGTPASLNKVYRCFGCNKFQLSELRIKINLEKEDEANVLQCVAFQEHTYKLLGVNPEDELPMTHEEKLQLCDLRNEEIQNQNVLFTLRKKVPTSSAYLHDSYIVTQIQDNPDHIIPTTPSPLADTQAQSSGLTPQLQHLVATHESTICKNLLPSLNAADQMSQDIHDDTHDDWTPKPSKKSRTITRKGKRNAIKEE